MAENKHYITQMQDNGTLMISEDVIADIVAHAISEVKGVISLNTKTGSDFAELFGKKNWARGIKVTISQSDDVKVDCNISVRFGENVVEVCKSAQQAVINELESVTGLKIAAVNMNVYGIIHQ